MRPCLCLVVFVFTRQVLVSSRCFGEERGEGREAMCTEIVFVSSVVVNRGRLDRGRICRRPRGFLCRKVKFCRDVVVNSIAQDEELNPTSWNEVRGIEGEMEKGGREKRRRLTRIDVGSRGGVWVVVYCSGCGSGSGEDCHSGDGCICLGADSCDRGHGVHCSTW